MNEQKFSSEVPVNKGSDVVRCKMKPALDDDAIENLMEQGIGVLDFDAGPSATPETVPETEKDGAARSFSVYRRFTRCGGYGVLSDEGSTRLVIGHATGPCGMFLPLQTTSDTGETRSHKAFQFDRFAVLDKEKAQEKFDEVYTAVRNRDQLQTLTTIGSGEGNKGPGREAVLDAFHELEQAGELRRPR